MSKTKQILDFSSLIAFFWLRDPGIDRPTLIVFLLLLLFLYVVSQKFNILAVIFHASAKKA